MAGVLGVLPLLWMIGGGTLLVLKVLAVKTAAYDQCSDFKKFENAAITIRGIELAEKVRKDQYKTAKLSGRPITAPENANLFSLA